MATLTVESPGIASAKEEAAAILYARQPQPVAPAPVMTETVSNSETKPARPSFAVYRQPEPMYTPAKPDTSGLRPYKTFDEIKPTTEPQVIKPYIDGSDYLTSAVAATTVVTPAVVEESEVVTTSVPAVQSVLDTELEEDTQYVVKFKRSTIVAAALMASVFLLMTVLCIVNIVSLVNTSAQVSHLINESSALQQTLQEKEMEWKEIEESIDTASSRAINYEPSASVATPTSEPADSSFFDWLCHSLSQLFG